MKNETKHFLSNFIDRNQCEEKSLPSNFPRDEIAIFTGEQNARSWFREIDLKFCQMKLSMVDRIEIIPFCLAGDAMIWFSVNREKIHSYIEFCQMFHLNYLQNDSPSDRNDAQTTELKTFDYRLFRYQIDQTRTKQRFAQDRSFIYHEEQCFTQKTHYQPT